MSSEVFWQQTEDWHTAGEPFRIVKDLPPGSLKHGLSVPEQHLHIMNTPSHPLDLLRQSLCLEPRGHADMYGCFILPPDDAGAHFGVLFWHRDGFSTACGHGTIALGYWAAAHNLIERNPGGTTGVIIDAPSGRVVAKVSFNFAGKVSHVDFINVTSFQISKSDTLSVNVAGQSIPLKYDLSYGGAVFACVKAADLNLSVEPPNHQSFIDVARQIKAKLRDSLYINKQPLASVCFFEEKGETTGAVFQKNVVVYGEGSIDRSPCGSGTSARLAVLLAEGRVNEKKHLVHESVIGTRFEAHVVKMAPGESSFPGCVPRVRGEAHLVGKMDFFIDPTDPIFPGFVFV